ncbi:MAG: hypothetical protein U0795_06260 [Pirellulales bacterium]
MSTADTTTPGSPKPAGGGLDFFVIDSGWNEHAKKVLDDHLQMFEDLLSDHRLYVLNTEQSKGFLKQNIELIGKDPVLVMLDSDARVEKRRYGYGFRLCLGVMSPKKMREHLSTVLRIACDSRKNGKQMMDEIRSTAHREGFDGMMELIGEVVRPEA